MIAKYSTKQGILVFNFNNKEIYYENEELVAGNKTNKKIAESRLRLLQVLIKAKEPMHTADLYYAVYKEEYRANEDSFGKKLRNLINETKKQLKEIYSIDEFIVNDNQHGYKINSAYKLISITEIKETKTFLPDCYIDPTKYAKQIARAINDSYQDGIHKVFAVYGKYGIGKTKLIEYFEKLGQNKDSTQIRIEGKPIRKVLNLSYQGSLRSTILSLISNPQNFTDPYEEVIKYLRRFGSNDLLVINRYNNLNAYNEINDQSETNDNRTYTTLLDLDITVIIVTTVDISKVNSIKQIAFNGYSRNELLGYFKNKTRNFKNVINASKKDGFEKDLVDLISAKLGYNTLLISSVASLLEKVSFDTIKEAFPSLTVSEIDDSFFENYDGKPIKDTFMGHFKTAFEQSLAFKNDADSKIAKKIFCNLALLPPEGMEDDLFFEMAFPKEEHAKIKSNLESLLGSSWINWDTDISKCNIDELEKDKHGRLKPKSAVCKIGLNPIVRELIVRQYLSRNYKSVSYFTNQMNAAERAGGNKYKDKFREYAKLAHSASISLEKANKFDLCHLKLKVNAAQCYDILKEYETSAKLGKEALAELDKPKTNKICPDAYELAYLYNRASNSIQHYYKNNEDITSLLAPGKGFKKAEELLKGKNDIKSRKLLSQIHGNEHAILFKTIVDYKKADKSYEKMLNERLAIYKKSNDYDTIWMLAYAYKGFGTSKFYMTRTTDDNTLKYSYLKESVENHWISLQCYNAYSRNNGIEPKQCQEYMVELNRFVGSSLSLLESNNFKGTFLLKQDDKFPKHKGMREVKLNFDKYTKLLNAYIEELIYYFDECNRIKSELAIALDSKKRLTRILGLLK